MNGRDENQSEGDTKANSTLNRSSASGRGTQDDGLEIHEIATILRGGKKVIAITTAALLALAIIYVFVAHPVYQSDGMIQIQQQNQPTSSTDILSLLLPMAQPTQAEIAIMTSRAVLDPVVEKLHLNIEVSKVHFPVIGRFFGNDQYRSVSVTRLRVPAEWKDRALTLKVQSGTTYVLDSPGGRRILHGKVGQLERTNDGKVEILVNRLDARNGERFKLTRLYDQVAAGQLRKKLNAVEVGKDTGIVNLTIRGRNPGEIAAILNAVERQYIKQNVAATASQAEKSLAFIKKELPELKRKLDQAQTRLTQFMQKNGAVGLDQQSKAFLDELTALESQLEQINLSKAAFSQSYTANYPAYRALQNQARTIQDKIHQIEAKINGLPQKEQSYLDLTQNADVYKKLYTALLAKAQDLRIEEAGTVGSARIVDHAVPGVTPVAPRKVLIIALALVLGVILGAAIVFLRRTLNQAIEDAAILEEEFSLPVYGVIPHSPRQASLERKARKAKGSKIPMLLNHDPTDPLIEAIRSLRTGLSFVMTGRGKRVFSIGGCTPSAGKSFLSVNLAHLIANETSRILLIDADMRRGHLERYLSGKKTPGLCDILRRDAGVEDVIQHSPYNKYVDLMPSGEYPPDPFELLERPYFEEVVRQCSENYDMVIIDVPPILSVADAASVARVTAANFLVVRSGVQTIREIRLALDRYRQNGAQVTGFILNDLSAQAQSHTYGTYGGAYKRYKYDAKNK